MANEIRLIDAHALTEHIKDLPTWFGDGGGSWHCLEGYPKGMFDPEDIVSAIDNAPTVDAVEVVHGYWDDSGRYQFPSGRIAIRCSICGCALSKSEYNLFNWNYCPVCGAKMDGGVKNA